MKSRSMSKDERTTIMRVMGMVGANFQEAMPSAITWETEIEGLAAQSCWDTLRQNIALGFESVFGILGKPSFQSAKVMTKPSQSHAPNTKC